MIRSLLLTGTGGSIRFLSSFPFLVPYPRVIFCLGDPVYENSVWYARKRALLHSFEDSWNEMLSVMKQVLELRSRTESKL